MYPTEPDDTGQFRFRIPKLSVAVLCRTLPGEEIRGDIFLDITGAQECSSRNVIDFFHDESRFFALRMEETPRPALIAKRSLISVEVIGRMDRFEKETSMELAMKKNAVIHFCGSPPMQVVLLLNMPREYSRLLDFLNRCETFLPAVHEGQFTLINATHILRVEEEE